MSGRSRDPLLSAFGAVVRRRRTERAESQQKLAEAAGMHDTYLGGVERGERNLSLRNISRIATALGVSMGELMTDVDAVVERVDH